MPDILPITAQGLIEASCRHYGGYYVPFSQSREPVRSWIGANPLTRNGICQALAARWMVEHANGSSLWLWLAGAQPGDQIDADLLGAGMDRLKISRLMVDAIEFSQHAGPLANPTTGLTLANYDVRTAAMGDLDYQDFVTSKFVDFWAGLRRRTLPADYVQATSQGGFSPHTGMRLGLRLNKRTLLSPGGCYVLIGVTGASSGHAMAAFVADDVAFFDPNFGEFYFEDRAGGQAGYNRAFAHWFLNYWQFSGYTDRYNTFRVLSYGKRMDNMPYDGTQPLPAPRRRGFFGWRR